MTVGWLIRGGTVVDGTGAPRQADVALAGDRVVAIEPGLDREHRQPGEELPQGGLAADRVARVVDALVQLGERDDAHGQADWPQLIQPRRDGRDAVEMGDDPVSVDEVARPHRRAGGRVVTRRSAYM
jgi:hypothetical protein